MRDREKNYKAVMQTIQFEGVPICSMCRYKQMTYMYSVSLTTGPIHTHYPHYPNTCTLCLFMSVQFSDPPSALSPSPPGTPQIPLALFWSVGAGIRH